MKPNISPKYFGVGIGCLTILIHILASCGQAEKIYYFYNNYIFRFIRILYDYTLGFIPFPVVYILFLILIIIFVKWIRKSIGQSRIISKVSFIRLCMLSVLNFSGWVLGLFYFLWAFNYYEPSIEDKLQLPRVKIDSLQLVTEFKDITNILHDERFKITVDTQALNIDIDWNSMENEIRIVQSEILTNWGDNVDGKVRIRKLYPEGLLLRISTAGVYIPFVCEGHIDPGLNKMQWPFTAAHEMAHGYGYTDEGVCNFIGFLTCIKSNVPYIRYSGLLAYWRYLYHAIKIKYPQIEKEMSLSIGKGVIEDLKAIRRDADRFPDILPEVRDVVYDSYLKSHGVQKGLNSYNELIIHVLRWKQSVHSFTFH